MVSMSRKIEVMMKYNGRNRLEVQVPGRMNDWKQSKL